MIAEKNVTDLAIFLHSYSYTRFVLRSLLSLPLFLLSYLFSVSWITSRAIEVSQTLVMTNASVAAARKLDEEGFENLLCITSGLQSVKPGTFESVGTTELQDAGKAGLVTIQGKISAVLGTILICAYLFITFFPEQAEKLLELSPTG